MANKKGTFKSKGANILKGKPSSMESFLKDIPDTDIDVPKLDVEMRKSTNTQSHKSTKAQKQEPPSDETERFHLQIRKDLADKVFDEILSRKRQRNGKKATQRAVVEEAIENLLC